MKKILMASITFMLILVVGCKFAATTIDPKQRAELTAGNDLNSDEPTKGVSVMPSFDGSGTSFYFELTFMKDFKAVKLDSATVTADNFKLYKIEPDPIPIGKAVAKSVTVSLSAENKVKIAFDPTGDGVNDTYIVYADAKKIRFSNSALRMNGNQNNVIDEDADSFFYIHSNSLLENYRKMYYDGIFPFSVTGYKDETNAFCVAGDTTMLLTAMPLDVKPIETTLVNLKIQKWNYETAAWDLVSAKFAVKTTNATPAKHNVIATIPAMKEKDIYRVLADHPDKLQYETGVSDGVGLSTISGKYSKKGEISSPSNPIAVSSGVKSEYAALEDIVGSDGLSFTVKSFLDGPVPLYALQITAKGSDAASLAKVKKVWEKIKEENAATTPTVQFFLFPEYSSEPVPFTVDYLIGGEIQPQTDGTEAMFQYPIISTADPSGLVHIFVSNNFKLPNILAVEGYTAEVYPFGTKYPQPGSLIFPAKNWSLMYSEPTPPPVPPVL